MPSDAVLVQGPSIDFSTLLGLSQQALGKNLAAPVDSSPIELSDAERFLSCLAAMQKTPITMRLLAHVTYSVLIAAEEGDMLDILQICGMPFVITDTLRRGVQLALVTGTLAQWRAAVEAGSTREGDTNVRSFFNRLQALFETARVNIWKDFDRHPLQDHTCFLTHKR